MVKKYIITLNKGVVKFLYIYIHKYPWRMTLVLPVYLTSVRPVEISQSLATESFPLDRMYLEFFEKMAEQTSAPS